MRQEHGSHSNIPLVGSLASIEPKLDAFLSRLMLRSTPSTAPDADDFERLDVMDGLHRSMKK